MISDLSPLVSVLTPVYNGAGHLQECIESVLAQSYPHWEYTIVNNCSTDDSLKIAQDYAAREPRIRVVNNDRVLSKVANHNRALLEMGLDAKYCKFVFADDWLYPGCIEDMVRLAEHEPSIGLVGAYTTDGEAVLWPGPRYPSGRVPGRSVCRSILLGGPYLLGSMTSLLVRSDLLRRRNVFDEQNPYRKMAACFEILRTADYGYIHQVLSYRRPRERAVEDFDDCILGRVCVLRKYGRMFLTDDEYHQRWQTLSREYHQVLAQNMLRIRPRQYWKHHMETLAVFGSRINPGLLTTSVIASVAQSLSHPCRSIRRGWNWWSRAVSRRAVGGFDPRHLADQRSRQANGD